MRNSLFLLLLVLLSTSLLNAQKRKSRRLVKQPSGLCGTVVEKRGNQMPGPGRSLPAGRPVSREVAVFSVLTTGQVVSDDAGFITDLKGTKPVQTVQADANGKFCFNKLPDGQYSVLVHEKQGWYANSFDAMSHINPVMVQRGKAATIIIEITHQAAF